MRHQVTRFLFEHRRLPQRILRLLAPDPLPVRLRDFTLLVRLDDWAVGTRIAIKKTYEPNISEAMGRILKPGMRMLDIGSNIGYFSMLAAAKVGPTGRVLAFDPSKRNLDLLRQSAALNRFTNIDTHCLAVANETSRVSFSMDDSNGGINRGEIGVSAEWVQAVDLDHYLPDDQAVDVVKIDIEGSEGLAIQGMRRLIANQRPVLFTEFSPEALPRFSRMSAEDYLDLLRESRYQVQSIPLTGPLPPPQDNDQIMRTFVAASNDHIDLLATPL